MKVNWPRSRLEIHLRYVGSPEETRWRCELAGTKSLVRLPSKSCSAPGARGSLIGPGASEKRTRYTLSSVVLALIFPSHHNPSSPPCTQSGIPQEAPCRGSGGANWRRQHKRNPALGNAPRCCGRARAVPPRSAFRGRGGWFGGAGPACRLRSAQCGGGRGGGPFLAPRKVQRVPANASCISPR